jgi:hypothetical protein
MNSGSSWCPKTCVQLIEVKSCWLTKASGWMDVWMHGGKTCLRGLLNAVQKSDIQFFEVLLHDSLTCLVKNAFYLDG